MHGLPGAEAIEGDSDHMRQITRTAVLAVAAALLAALATLIGARLPRRYSGGGTANDNGYARPASRSTSPVTSASGAVGSVPGPPPMCWWRTYSSTMLGHTDRSTPATRRR